MAVKKVTVDDIGVVTVQKRRGSKSLRISISSKGAVRVTMPAWSPYSMGLQFIESKKAWIIQNMPRINPLAHSTPVGKAHHLVFVRSASNTTIRSSIKGNEIIITLPDNVSETSPKAQESAKKATVKALKKEAEHLLPQRLELLARQHGFTYKSVSIKRLSSRWGSCDQHTNIALNCYLMQLPWHLIDYVLLHELTHTRIMAHGERFWAELGKYIPNLATVRKEIRTHSPTVTV